MDMKQFSKLTDSEKEQYKKCKDNPAQWDDRQPSESLKKDSGIVNRIVAAATLCAECPLLIECDSRQKRAIANGQKGDLKGTKDEALRARIISEKAVPVGVVAGVLYTNLLSIGQKVAKQTGDPLLTDDDIVIREFGARTNSSLYALDITID